MKPWRYTDEFTTRKSSEKEISAVEYINNLSKEFEVDKLTESYTFGKDNSKEFEDNSSGSDFFAQIRLPRPNTARIEAAKTMGFRDGLEQFKNPKSYDHRPVS